MCAVFEFLQALCPVATICLTGLVAWRDTKHMHKEETRLSPLRLPLGSNAIHGAYRILLFEMTAIFPFMRSWLPLSSLKDMDVLKEKT